MPSKSQNHWSFEAIPYQLVRDYFNFQEFCKTVVKYLLLIIKWYKFYLIHSCNLKDNEFKLKSPAKISFLDSRPISPLLYLMFILIYLISILNSGSSPKSTSFLQICFSLFYFIAKKWHHYHSFAHARNWDINFYTWKITHMLMNSDFVSRQVIFSEVQTHQLYISTWLYLTLR